MSKRRTESTSSSSSSDGDSNKIGGDGGATSPLRNEKGSCKKARNCSADSEERSALASTSTQLQRELGIIVKDEESEESEVEHSDIIPSTPETEYEYSDCASPVAAQQSNPEVRKSNRVRISTKKKLITEDPKKPPPSKRKVSVPKPHEKYFDGCIVMGSTCIPGYPLWPGIIRKAGEEDANYPDYFRYRRGNILFCVQFFTDPTTLVWQKTCDIRMFNPAKPNRCCHRDPSVVAEFEKGIRIVKAALNFPVEARLIKFTLENETGIDDLLREIDSGADQNVVQNDSVVNDENEGGAPTGLGTGGLNNSIPALQTDSVARDEDSPAPPAQRNEENITNVFAGLKKQAELLKKKNREKEEAIKSLTTDNSKLAEENTKLTLRLQSKDAENGKIESLEGKLKAKDEMIAELRANLNRTEKDKLSYMEELEKMRSEVKSLEKVFNDDMTEDGTGT